MSKILDSIKNSVKQKALEEAFKSDDGVSEVAEPAFDSRKNVPAKKDLKKTGPDLPGDVDNVAADNSKIVAGKDKAKSDNNKDINHKKYTQKNKASVIGEDFGKDKNKMVSDDDEDQDDNQSDDSSSDGDQEVDIKVRKVTKEDLDVSEHLTALFGKEDLSEAFKTKSKNIFETAVVAAANEVISEVIEQILEANAVEQDQFIDAMVEQMDSYLDKVVSEWLEENRVEVQTNVRTEIAESFLAGLKTLFEDHYIDIPEDKVEVVGELVAKVEALEASLDEEINKNVALANELIESKKEHLVTEHIEGLSDNQKERLRMLAEGIDFESEEDFVSQIEELKESYFNTEVKKNSIDSDDEPLVLQEELEDKPSRSSSIGDVIAQSITKNIRKTR